MSTIWSNIWGGSGGSGSSYPSVNTFADLPLASSVAVGTVYIVATASGIWPFNRKPAGLYRSDGAAWAYMSAYPDLMKDGNFGIQNSTDGTKIAQFDAATIATGTTRTFTFPNNSGTFALASGLTGGQIIYGGLASGEELTLMSNVAGNGKIGLNGFQGTSYIDTANNKMRLGQYAADLTYTLLDLGGNINNYVQANIRNNSTGQNASADYVCTADDGTNSANFVNIGINSSGWPVIDTFFNDPHTSYVIGNGGRLDIGTETGHEVWLGANEIVSQKISITGVTVFPISPTVPTPTTATQAANKDYVDSVVTSSFWDNVRVASVAEVIINTGLENGDVVDGVTLVTGDRVLLKNQSATEENGLYEVVASGAASRAVDANTAAEVNNKKCIILAGTQAGKFFFTTSTVVTIDNDPISLAELSAGTYTASDGVQKIGADFSADSTVVRTSGVQSIAGAKTFSTTPIFSALTIGAVPFISTGGQVAQDATKFFWDNTNKYLGIGTATPNNYLNVSCPMATNTINLGIEVSKGTGYFRAANGTSQIDQFLPVFFGKSTYTLSNTGLSFVALQGNSTDTTTATIAFSARNAAGTGGVGATQRAWEFLNYTTPLVTILGDGKLGIGTGTPTQALEVNGNVSLRKVGFAGTAPILTIRGYSNSSSALSYLVLGGSRGLTVGSEVATQSGDILATVDVNGVNSSNAVALCARWWVVQDGAAGATYTPGRFEFYTVGATGGALALTINSAQKVIIAKDILNIATQKTPASATDTGVKGDICHDTGYIYVCTATNTWRRAAIATW